MDALDAVELDVARWRDGPDTSVIGASGPSAAIASGTDGTMSRASTMQT